MYESSRVPSNSISCSESTISKLFNPNPSICGLPLHNNPTLLSTQSPLPTQPPLSQGCKYNSLPSTSCTTPSKSPCSTKGDILTGLSTNNSLVGTFEKPGIDQKLVVQGGKSNKVETETKGISFGSERNCSDNKNLQNPSVPSVLPVKPVTPAPSNPLPKIELTHKEPASGFERNCSDNKNSQSPSVPSVLPVKPVTPAPSNPLPKIELTHKESASGLERNCSDNKNSQSPSVPPVKPVTSVPPVTPVQPPVTPVTPVTPVQPPVVVAAGLGY